MSFAAGGLAIDIGGVQETYRDRDYLVSLFTINRRARARALPCRRRQQSISSATLQHHAGIAN